MPFTISSKAIQGKYCSPLPSLPPSPHLYKGNILASAPPFVEKTMPVLIKQTLACACRAIFSQSWHNCAVKVFAVLLVSVIFLFVLIAVNSCC